jgi:hypothetical protein
MEQEIDDQATDTHRYEDGEYAISAASTWMKRLWLRPHAW